VSDGSSPRDLGLAGVGLVLAVLALSAAFRPTSVGGAASTREVVAQVRRSTGALQVRPAETLGWRPLERGDALREADSVYAPPGSDAQLRFLDGTALELDENSLVVIEPPRAGGRAITLRKGSVAGLTGSTPLTLVTAEGTATLPPQTAARVELSAGRLEVAVTRGAATVTASGTPTSVEQGARARFAADAVVPLPSWPVTLLEPAAMHRSLFHGAAPAITLRWQTSPPGARLQVARDRLFAFLTLEVAASGTERLLEAPGAGVSWWRIVDAAGAPLSESRRFSLIEDLAPAPRLPKPGQVLQAPPGTRVEFAWTPLPGVSRYLLEVSSSQGFAPVAMTETVSGTQVKVPVSLPEGSWYWRVRGADDALGETAACEPSRFRVIHKAIPDAPELLNPEVEVTP